MDEKIYPYKFSVVMSIYNVESFIHEAVNSLIVQDIGFEHIQIIMVDDGSTDSSGAICDEYAKIYPQNIVVIHKKNGGLSSARNAGVQVADGKYLNFFDPDDRLDKKVLSNVYKFFSEHEEEVDVVSVPLMMFGTKKGPHPTNDKFSKGNRVIDLEKEWWYFQMSLASAFLKADVAKQYCFQEDLIMACAEDSKELIKLFLRNPKLGVVRGENYRYRKRNDSLVGSVEKNRLWYIPYLEDYCQWAISYSLKERGSVPKNLQYTIMYDLQWKLRQQQIPDGILTEEETDTYISKMNSILSYIDDEIIIAQKQLWTEHKSYALAQKTSGYPIKFWVKDELLFVHQNIAQFWLRNFPITLEFVQLGKDYISIEGWIPHYLYLEKDPPNLIVKANGMEVLMQPVDRPEKTLFAGVPIVARSGFCFTVPLGETERTCLRFYCKTEYGDVWMKRLRYGKYFAVDDTMRSNYYWKDDWKLTGGKAQLNVTACGRKGHLRSELLLYKELWRSKRKGSKKAIAARILAQFFRTLNKKDIWLICDKANRADDNGEAFFRYMQQVNPQNTKLYFLIGKATPDFKRLSEIGKVIPYMSWRHKILYLISNYVISAYSHNEINNPFIGYHTPYRDLLQKCQYIFLQHGIIKDDLSKGLNRSHKDIKGFVTSTYEERKSILDTPAYLYHESEIWLTGLPRYDRLYHAEVNSIVIMPTWRRDLFGEYHAKDSSWTLKAGFEDSDFYCFYQGLLNHKRLLDKAEKMGYTIEFVPHPIFFPYIDRFSFPASVKVSNTEVVYRDIFARNKLLITDFSSVAFDFAYLEKPVIYTHFDKNHYAEGYFDYERDGFGEVEYDLESTVDRIIEYMENGCELKEVFRKRIERFFVFHDTSNCQRVYEKILELNKGN